MTDDGRRPGVCYDAEYRNEMKVLVIVSRASHSEEPCDEEYQVWIKAVSSGNDSLLGSV